MPLIKKYGAAVIVLALDDGGIPETSDERIKTAYKVYYKLTDFGIKSYDIMIDFLTLPISAGQDKALITFKHVRKI